MRYLLSAIAALLAYSGMPAHADTTAVYSARGGMMTMTVEIAANGDVRGEMGGTMLAEMRAKLAEQHVPPEQIQSPTTIMRDGEAYFIQPGPDGVVVVRMRDMATILAESIQKRGERPGGAPTPRDMAFAPRGQVTVNGRRGTAYFIDGAAPRDDEPDVVISTDPDLAELARAMADQFAFSTRMGATAFGWGSAGESMMAVLRTGAPLRFGPMELVSVRHDPIPPERFVLPAAPSTLDQVRTLMQPLPKADDPAAGPLPPALPAPRP
jgi:hypothetical protein